jgi:hypothetical protein
VIADGTQQPGWHDTVGGMPTNVVQADHAMVAVYVSAVDASCSAPRRVVGLGISLAAHVTSVTLVAWRRLVEARASGRGRAHSALGSAA